MSDRDIVDRIDELVDEQLANYDQRTGYDYNVGQNRCPHCAGDWHGLPITERVRGMHARYCGCDTCQDDLDAYRAAEDDSPVWCPGSTFIGPWATPAQLEQIRRGTPWGDDSRPWSVQIGWNLPPDPFGEHTVATLPDGQLEWLRRQRREPLPAYSYREHWTDELEDLGIFEPTRARPGGWTLPELSFPMPGFGMSATSFSWALHADTGRYEQGEQWPERLGGTVVLAGEVEHQRTDRGEDYLAGFVVVRDISPRVMDWPELLTRGVWVAIQAAGNDPVYVRVHRVERVDYGGTAWRITFDQRYTLRELVRVPETGRREWQPIELVEPSPPVEWGPNHPHYQYTSEEQQRIARLQDELETTRRPPRPSATPPMWANNPTRTNRRRNR